MSNIELESLIVGYLDGTASRSQVIRLRDAIKSSPEMSRRFQARLRLHRAQLAFLRHKESGSASSSLLWLRQFAQRTGRSFAHLCLLALVFVQLRVTIPAEYSGLMFYVEAPVAEEASVLDSEREALLLIEPIQEAEAPLGADMSDVVMPSMLAPDTVGTAEDSSTLDV